MHGGPDQHQGSPGGRRRVRCLHRAGAFTIVDVLVSIVVVGVLIAIMLPGLAAARDSSRRVVCASNLRQVGIGVFLYGNDNNDRLPALTGVAGFQPEPPPAESLVLLDSGGWDGLGLLFEGDFLSDGQVVYCPAHTGDDTYARFAPSFRSGSGFVRGNFFYRGRGPVGETNLGTIQPYSALAVDGFEDERDSNHADGANLLAAGLSVAWREGPLTSNTGDFAVLGDGEAGKLPAGPALWRKLDGGPGAGGAGNQQQHSEIGAD